MVHQKVSLGLALILVIMIWSGADAQSSGCTNVLISMSPCLNYITGNSTTPSSSCCTQLGSVVRSQPQCLCQVLNGGGSNLGININQTQALALPMACNVQTPPVSRCNAAAPSATPGSTTNSSSTNIGGGSKIAPASSGDGTSDATSTVFVPMMFVILFIASYVSIFTA